MSGSGLGSSPVGELSSGLVATWSVIRSREHLSHSWEGVLVSAWFFGSVVLAVAPAVAGLCMKVAGEA